MPMPELHTAPALSRLVQHFLRVVLIKKNIHNPFPYSSLFMHSILMELNCSFPPLKTQKLASADTKNAAKAG